MNQQIEVGLAMHTPFDQFEPIEDSFKFLKTCLGWEDVQVLDWQALRMLVALAWVATGFLYGLPVVCGLGKCRNWLSAAGR